MSRILSLSVLLAVVLASATALAERHSIDVVYDKNAAGLTADVGSPIGMSPGDDLVIAITNDAPPADAGTRWHFTLANSPAKYRSADGNVWFEVKVPEGGPWDLSFTDDDGKVGFATLPFVKKTIPPPGPVAGSGTTTYQRQKAYDRRKNVANLYFDENGLPLDATALPRDLDDNDVINVYLALPKGSDVQSYKVQVDGTIRGNQISVVGESALGDLSKLGVLHGLVIGGAGQDRDVYLFGTYGPFSGPSVTITITSTRDGQTSQRAHVLRINPTYLAGLQFGVGESAIARNDFGLYEDPNSGETLIVNHRPDEGDLRPALFIVFYGANPFGSGFMHGRDLEEDPGLAGRLFPMVGVGLDDIGDEYYAGLTYELANGLNVYWAIQYLKTKQLGGGLAPGDVFTGGADQLPITDKWKAKRVFGLSVDLRIATRVLGGVLGGSGR